ncbi:glucose PTS transporter subunit IIA [Propioniciclava soli]|uniref:Glucose PTS transporter subunit IIA n=1 Tax=Propioniciclava soli TaxID=2775081 RepID=A0ABZ3C5P0_9ACTN
MSPTQTSAAEQIVEAVGGPGNIASLTHCATRLRFELNDASVVDANVVDAIPGVMGSVPQAGNRYQIIIGGAVQTYYENIQALPVMSGAGKKAAPTGDLTDAEVKAQARAARGKYAWVDNFFEFLSDSFRPILGALLGASLIITFMSLMATTGVIGNWSDPTVDLGPSWNFVNLMWQGVFVFLPLMVAYNASKKVGADPWVGFAIMAVLMLPGFNNLAESARDMTIAGQDVQVVDIFGIPLALRDYGSQVFPPLLMAGVLGPLTKFLKRIIPEQVQLVFVPFISMVIMIPLTAFLIGPIGIYAGAALAGALQAINAFNPFIFAIVIPLAYPFMVPLGLHWPINAIMLLNIQNLGYDFIQGPMGAWNFACFGATAGVLFIAMRDKEIQMRQTATGALAAGLLGGISEPSLYGIHLRYKRIYPRMLVGCLLGGLVVGIGGGLRASAFAFTSLLTIPVFTPMVVYIIAIAVAFFTAMILVIISDYRTPEQREESRLAREQLEQGAPLAADRPATPGAVTDGTGGSAVAGGAIPVASAATATAVMDAPAADGSAGATAASSAPATFAADDTSAPAEPTDRIAAPMAGRVVSLDDVEDKVFSSRALGEGVGIEPTSGHVVAPISGKVITVPKSGHAFGIKSDDGVEVLVHVGIDTVQMNGEGFDVHVAKGDRVHVGDTLVDVDLDAVRAAGYPTTTIVAVTNTKKLGAVTPLVGKEVGAGDPVIDITH